MIMFYLGCLHCSKRKFKFDAKLANSGLFVAKTWIIAICKSYNRFEIWKVSSSPLTFTRFELYVAKLICMIKLLFYVS